MKKIICLILSVAIGMVVDAAPKVSTATMSQPSMGDRTVTLTYVLTHAPVIVTIDIQTNGVSIGGVNMTHMEGAANCLVDSAGTKTVTWRPDLAWPSNKLDGVTAVVTAWATNAPPDYMAVDLTRAETIRYYADIAALPEALGPTSDVYRTTQMLFKRIHAYGRPWACQAITTSGGKTVGSRSAHTLTLDHDYYIGVFEVTQRQWELLTGNRPSAFKNDAYYMGRPVEQVNYASIRGARYPAAFGEGSYLALLKTRTGVTFDLPGEAEWEYAARAGNIDMRWGDGSKILTYSGNISVGDDNLDQVGRYNHNGGKQLNDTDWNRNTATADQGTAIVGTYRPNLFGIYDMHGNVWEICADRVGLGVDALTAEIYTGGSSENVVARGASHVNGVGNLMWATGRTTGADSTSYARGFRLVQR